MTTDSTSADYSLRILWSLARWIEDTKGAAELERIAASAGVKATDFDGSTRWASVEQFEKFLEAGRELAGSDLAFQQACAYRFPESYGAFRYMTWALTPQLVCDAAVKAAGTLTRVGKFETVVSQPTAYTVRYRSSAKESRLMCLSRQVGWTYGPTVWGAPPAQLVEGGCIANGDEFCEYQLRWLATGRALPTILGAIGGGLTGFGLTTFSSATTFTLVALPILGAALGYIYELRRMNRLNSRFGAEMNDVIRNLGETEAENRSEIFALHQRQREWIALMEQQVTERTRTLEKIVSGIDDIQQNRVSTLRGFSHDLRNPLFVVRGNAQFLLDRIKDGEEGEALRDMDLAAGQIEGMLSRLMEVATQDTGFVKLTPKTLKVAPLADTFRRRLKALVHGRDIKVSVFCTREAPEELFVDPVVFDRVVDNMLTNAAKYTQRGSIVLELSGTPAIEPEAAFFTLKLSDTGQGIPPERIERIFRPRPANEPSTPQSYGIGLSSVVRLMAQIGGRIDVMTKPGVGTTFWGHFPVVAPEPHTSKVGEDNLESMIMRVVTIRKAEGA